jgi:hypothetical protein
VRDGREILIIKKENKLERRLVDIIWKDDEHAVVKEGLTAGEVMCATPLAFAVDGVVVIPHIEGELGAGKPPRQPGASPAKRGGMIGDAGTNLNQVMPRN